MLNKKLSALLTVALFATVVFSACAESEKKTTDEKTAADSAAISPMRDTSNIDTTADPRPLRPAN